MKNIAVYLGSSIGKRPVFCEKAYEFGKLLAENDFTIIYGGASVGTMKALADGAASAGGKIIGIFPKGFKGKTERHFTSFEDLLSKNCTEMIFVADLAERKQKMAEICDCCVALPGGWGTIDELSEHIVAREVGQNSKPVFILNIEGYYDALKVFADHMVTEGMISPEGRSCIIFCDTVDEIIEQLKK